jgi:hypothetical protein
MVRTFGGVCLAATLALLSSCAGDAGDDGGQADLGTSLTTGSGLTTTSEAPATTATTTATTSTTVATTTAVVVTPAPTVASPTQPVVAVQDPTAPRDNCSAAGQPPDGATNVQATYAFIDNDDEADIVWLYDAMDGTHLQVRTARGGDDIRLPYSKGSVAVGKGQVDRTVDSGEPEEILAVTANEAGQRLVGIYGFVVKTGCIEPFVFEGGAPFVYLVSRTGTLSGLQCVSDGVTGHLEGTVAVPGESTFATSRMVYEREGRRLSPSNTQSGTVPAAAAELMAKGSDVTGCSLSGPAF